MKSISVGISWHICLKYVEVGTGAFGPCISHCSIPHALDRSDGKALSMIRGGSKEDWTTSPVCVAWVCASLEIRKGMG
jgi:hypothetical protein